MLFSVNNKIMLICLLTILNYSFINSQNVNQHSFFQLLNKKQELKTKENRQVEIKKKLNNVRNELRKQKIINSLKEIQKLKKSSKSYIEISTFLNLKNNNSGTGSISGKVTEIDGITPINEFCLIIVYDTYGNACKSGYTSANLNGYYTIYNLEVGKYYVQTNSDHYYDLFFENTADFNKAKLVDVSNGLETKSINFSLEKFKGVITGIVQDEKDKPIVNCFVRANNINILSGSAGNSCLTYADGTYIIDGLPTGKYVVYAEYSYDDKNLQKVWHNNVRNEESASIVEVNEPQVTNNINFILETAGAIKGKVLDENNNSVEPYSTNIACFDKNGDYVSGGTVDENGEFIVGKLSNESYYLYIEYYGSENYYSGFWYNNSTTISDAEPIYVVPPDTVTDIIINMAHFEVGSITGTVHNYDGSLMTKDYVIYAFEENSDYPYQVSQIDKGIYTISNLPSGSYKLKYNNDAFYTIVGQEPAVQWYNRATSFNDGDFIEVDAPNTTKNIDFYLTKGAYIQGRIFDHNNNLLSYSGSVLAYNSNKENISAVNVYNDGLYFITGLPLGEYKLQYEYSGYENYSNQWYNDKMTFETSDAVNVNTTAGLFDYDFHLKKNKTLLGYICDKDDKKLTNENSNIWIICYDAQTGEVISNSSNSILGGYKIISQLENVKICAVIENVNWLENVNENLAVTYYPNGKSFNDENSQIINFGLNDTLVLNTITMQEATGSISGNLFSNEKNIENENSYDVFIYDEFGYLVTVSSYFIDLVENIGEYKCSGLFSGKYYALALTGFFENKLEWRWYSTTEITNSLEDFSAKQEIPLDATPIYVTNGETTGIDFNIQLTSYKETTQKINFALSQNYPNPFNPSTTIKYAIPSSMSSDITKVASDFNLRKVTLKVYDILGQEVVTLVNQKQRPGNYEIEWNAREFPSGVYLYRLSSGSYTKSKKMILIK